MHRDESKEKEKDVKLVRPGDPRVPCIAILYETTSELKLVNLEGGRSSSVKISAYRSLGIVTNNGEVFAVTEMEILKLRSDGTRENVAALPGLNPWSRVVWFQKKIFIIRPKPERMLCFDPADNSLTDLPGCGLGDAFCAVATDDFILSMGGLGTKTQTMKFDPLKLKWEKKAQMRKKRTWAAAATLDGKIYVMGGAYHRTSVEYYNPGNNSWTETSDMNAGRFMFSACVDGDRLYAVGGDNGSLQHTIEVYDKNKWTVVTKFQIEDYDVIYSCFWPHVSQQPGQLVDETDSKLPTTSKEIGDEARSAMVVMASDDWTRAFGADEEIGDNLSLDECSLTNSSDFTSESAENTFLQGENLQETKKEVGPSDRTEISLPERSLKKEKDVASEMTTVSGKLKESNEVMLSEASQSRTFSPDEDYLQKSQLEDETDSKPTTSKGFDDKSESSMIAIKSDDGTEAETGVEEETIPTTSKKINDESESATKIVVKLDDETAVETTATTAAVCHVEAQGTVNIKDRNIDVLAVAKEYLQITDDIFMDKEKPLKEGAKIYEGYQEHVGGQKVPLAIKVIVPCTQKSIREVEHLISLASHPNVVRIVSSKEHNDRLPTLYIAMELCSSQNLQDYLNENRKKNIPFDFKRTMLYSEGLIHGIKHIHRKRIIHGDLKPANILFSLLGDQIKISDFGISKNLQHLKSVTKITSQGTDGYRAPETYSSYVISMKADIYSLGIILYSVFANGKHPFGEDLDLRPYNIKKNIGRDFSGLPEEMGAKNYELVKLLEKMLEFDPERRPTIEEISDHPFFNSSRSTTAQDMRSHGNVTNITYNITGGAPTVVNAPVGQLATGNANITNQGSGNNFVAGSQENTDRSVTAGKALYGESTSSSVGENITVHRTGT